MGGISGLSAARAKHTIVAAGLALLRSFVHQKAMHTTVTNCQLPIPIAHCLLPLVAGPLLRAVFSLVRAGGGAPSAWRPNTRWRWTTK
jgi:hypothetical protein